MNNPAWPGDIYRALQDLEVRQVAYVPDAGHRELIARAESDADMTAVALTTEEEGVALSAGAWLGGQRGVVLMQSSGVGNCINAIASLTCAGRFPLLLLVTMRGEAGEGNPWQVPMGSAVTPVLATLGCEVRRCERAEDAYAMTVSAGGDAFDRCVPVALLIAQQLIGVKTFTAP